MTEPWQIQGHHVPCDVQPENGNHLAGAASSVVYTAGCSAPLHPVTAERNKWAAILCGIAPLAASREEAQATKTHKCCFGKTGDDVTISAHFWYLGISRGHILSERDSPPQNENCVIIYLRYVIQNLYDFLSLRNTKDI